MDRPSSVWPPCIGNLTWLAVRWNRPNRAAPNLHLRRSNSIHVQLPYAVHASRFWLPKIVGRHAITLVFLDRYKLGLRCVDSNGVWRACRGGRLPWGVSHRDRWWILGKTRENGHGDARQSRTARRPHAEDQIPGCCARGG